MGNDVGIFVGAGTGSSVGAGTGNFVGAGIVGAGIGNLVGAGIGSCVGTGIGNSVSAIISIFTASIMAVRSPLLPECINFRVASPAAILNMVEKDTNEYDNVPELIVAEAMAPPEAVTLAVSSAG